MTHILAARDRPEMALAMLSRMNELARAGRSFAMETTCAGRGHVEFLRRCQNDGWRVTLIFLWLNDPAIAIQRVTRRVAEGGHGIPRDVIIRRYRADLRNLISLYLPLADTAQIYDNSDGTGILIANQTRQSGLVIHDNTRWVRLREIADQNHDGS